LPAIQTRNSASSSSGSPSCPRISRRQAPAPSAESPTHEPASFGTQIISSPKS
jgi:hypothetical protein